MRGRTSLNKTVENAILVQLKMDTSHILKQESQCPPSVKVPLHIVADISTDILSKM